MALVKQLKRSSLQKYSIHGLVDCTYCTFVKGGSPYLQLDTYGSKTREMPGKKSQSLQFDRESLIKLREIIDSML